MKHETGIAIANFNLSEISKELGNLQEAERLVDESIDYARKEKANYLLCLFLAGYADLKLRQGRQGEAYDIAKEALALAQELNIPSVSRNCRMLLARITAGKDLKSAITQIGELLTECDDKNEAAEIHYHLFKLSGDERHRQAALGHYRQLASDPKNLLVKKVIAELEQADRGSQ